MSDKEASSPTPSTSAAEKIASSEGSGGAKNYSHGERQKPTSDAYRDNWDSIFGDKKKKPRKKKKS
jgi:hypothetical protein